MRDATVVDVDRWWARLMGVDVAWQGVTVRPHTTLGDYPGWYVAWRGAGLHVSAPATATSADVDHVARQPLGVLADSAWWAELARRRGLELRGPAVHTYLDTDPGPTPGVVDAAAADLETIRPQVTPTEWDDWATDHPVHPVGVVEEGRLVAAACLGDWDGTARDVAVVVVPDRRGHGLAARVGRSCASYAIREHGLARWRSAVDNTASVRTAQRLGFTSHATQLALRPPP